VDEDTLEGAALQAASDRDWSLVAVESGLDGALRRRLVQSQAPNLLTVETIKLDAGQLSDALKKMQEKYQADAALGVAVFPEERAVEIVLMTPIGAQERRLTFGGHPGLLSRWAVNTALNWLRQAAQGAA